MQTIIVAINSMFPPFTSFPYHLKMHLIWLSIELIPLWPGFLLPGSQVAAVINTDIVIQHPAGTLRIGIGLRANTQR